MNGLYKKILCIVTTVLLSLLFVQTTWHPFTYLKLKNDPQKAHKPELTFTNYCKGSFQSQVDEYLKENYATRAICIRTVNQYNYWFDNKKTCTGFMLPGKDNWMYYRPGVLDYYGKEGPTHFKTDFELRNYIDNQVDMLNELRGILRNDYGIELLSFIAPDKPFIYPEHLPDMERDTTMVNAGDYFAQRFAETDFPNIDMKPWYKAIADTSQRLLFMPMDSHWQYASVFGFDSLFRLMNSLNDFGIPQMKINGIKTSRYKGRQDDEATLNLLFKIPNHTPLYTADISVISDSTSRKPKVLFVGDSFIFAYEWLIPKKELTSYYENWFYYDNVYKGFNKAKYKLKDINKLRSVLNADFIVVYSVGYQWYHGTRGFVEDVLSAIKDPYQVEVAKTMNRIESDEEWMQKIREKAQDKGVSVERMLELDAQWVVEHKNK
ncbi:MAG: hypothetical protein J5708_00055 [Bacteroidales bacterium]|nr:hypothetical protein [Bacteroidales bacterium]